MVQTDGGIIAKYPCDSEIYPFTLMKIIAMIIDEA